jgi:signal transduction histidine kinase
VNHVQGNLHLLLPIIALNVIAFLMLWVRGRSVLDLWLMVMCCSWIFDLSLVLLADSRYAVGWYVGRFFQVQAVFVVLLLFLSEKTALYANLARASIQRRGARHARQIAMDAMAASLGHEIRQPLTAVLLGTNTAMLQARVAEPDLKEIHATLADIAADGQRIKEIIGGARTMFTKSTHDRQLLEVNKVVRDVLATVELELRLQRVTVKTALAENLPPVLGDAGQLHQVFLNLINNALEAMTTIAGRPSVLTVTSAIASSAIAVTVEDTGVGMPDKDSDRILEPFFSTKAGGTGVGLTICKVIIAAHSGRLQISANKPYGTIVRVTLPMGGDE